MIEINYLVIEGDEICCLVDCPRSGECANHSTALDMRTETGPRPKLQKKDTTILCSTFNNEFMTATFGAATLKQLSK